MVSGVSANSGQVGGKPTPLIHHINMEKWYEHFPACKGGQGSICDKRRIPIPGYDNELVPGGGTKIYCIQ